jgi:hypothetical protein
LTSFAFRASGILTKTATLESSIRLGTDITIPLFL